MSIVTSFLSRARGLLSARRRTPFRSRVNGHLHRFRPCAEPLEDRLLLAIRIWTGGAGATNPEWSNALNWENNLKPLAGDTARFLNNATNSKVDAAFTNSITALDIQNTYTGTLTIASTLDVTGTIGIAGGSVTVASLGSLYIRGTTSIDGRTVTNSGFIRWTLGEIVLKNGGTINNDSGSFIDATGGSSLISSGIGGGVFKISGPGSYSKNEIGVVTTIGLGVQFQLIGALASVNVTQGELRLKGGAAQASFT